MSYEKQGPVLHYVDSDGQRLKNNLFSVGSGSTHAYGVLDGEYHYDLTESEAIDLGRRAIYHATFRDAFSGGSVRGTISPLDTMICVLTFQKKVYHVYPEGWKAISLTDVYDLHYEYQDGPKPALK